MQSTDAHEANPVVQVVTISGRTIRPEALAAPALADTAIQRIDELLALAKAAGHTELLGHIEQSLAGRLPQESGPASSLLS